MARPHRSQRHRALGEVRNSERSCRGTIGHLGRQLLRRRHLVQAAVRYRAQASRKGPWGFSVSGRTGREVESGPSAASLTPASPGITRHAHESPQAQVI